MVELEKPKQYSPQDFVPSALQADENVKSILFRHYSSSLLALKKHDARIWDQVSSIASSSGCAIAGLRVAEKWESHGLESKGAAFREGIVPVFSLEKKRLVEGDYLLIISPNYATDEQGKGAAYRADLAVAAIKSLLGEPAALTLQLEFFQNRGEDKISHTSPSFRTPSSLSDSAIIYTDTSILNDTIKAIRTNGHTKAALGFFHSALSELSDPMRAVFYCSAIEALSIGNKVTGSVVKVYAGTLNEAEVKKTLRTRALNDYRNNFLHKGTYDRFDDGLERITQFLFWDCLSFRATGSHAGLALQMATKLAEGADP